MKVPVGSLKEQSLLVQEGGKSRLRWFSAMRPRRKTGSAPSGLLFSWFYSEFFLSLRPWWGADMKGRIVNCIFLMFRPVRIRFSHRQESFPASALPAPSSVICWGVSEITDWYVKTRGCGCQNWMCEKGLLPDPSMVRIFSLFGPAEIVFSDSDPHFPCVKLKLSGC